MTSVALAKSSPLIPEVLTFEEVRLMVEELHERNLDDEVHNLADMLVDEELNLRVPSVGWSRMTHHAKQQLGGLLGVQFDKWFGGIDGTEIQHEIGLRIPKLGKDAYRLVRTRAVEDTGYLVRALLSKTYQLIDDTRVFRRMETGLVSDYMGGFHFVLERLELPHDEALMSCYVMGFGDPVEIGDRSFWPTIILCNSEVGARSLTLDLMMMDLEEQWGFLQPTTTRLAKRVHRKIEDDKLDDTLEEAFLRAADLAADAVERLKGAVDRKIKQPGEFIFSHLRRNGIPFKTTTRIAKAFDEEDYQSTAFDVARVIATSGRNMAPESQQKLERLASLVINKVSF